MNKLIELGNKLAGQLQLVGFGESEVADWLIETGKIKRSEQVDEEDIEFDLLANRIKGREAMKQCQCAKVNPSDELSQHIININELIKHGNALRMLAEESPQAQRWADCVAKVKGVK